MAGPSVAVIAEDPLARAGLTARVRDAGLEVARALEPATLVPGAVAALPAHAAALAGAAAIVLAAALRDAGVPAVAVVEGEEEAAAALAGGARGAVPREVSAEALAAALEAAAVGLVAIDPAFVSAAARPPREAPAGRLTPREAEVLALLAEGLTNKALAARLGIAERTAKFHVEAILGKLDAESRAEAIVKAARLGLVAL